MSILNLKTEENYLGNHIELSNNKKGEVVWVKYGNDSYWAYKEQLNEYLLKITK